MKLSELLAGIEYTLVQGSLEIQITGLSQDTREDSLDGFLYFAVPGTQVDGHNYIDQAIEKGCSVVVCENIPEILHENISYVQVASVSAVMGVIASTFYGNPSQHMKVIAVTGTNGKTTVATVAYQALQHLQKKTVLFSTAGDFFDGSPLALTRKAPSSIEVIELHKQLAEVYKQGAEYVCLEATSHGLHQNRLHGLVVDVAIFTNLSQDHLDYHGTMNHYAEAKKRLFDQLTPDVYALINYDDEYGAFMVTDTKADIVSYGNNGHDYTFDIQETSLDGMNVSFNGNTLKLPVVGAFNAYNFLAVYASLEKLGFETRHIVESLESSHGVRGRLEIVPGSDCIGIVDYAHSPDALENVLTTLKQLPHNRIITVFGCGGDRDRAKRPQMALVAETHSDIVIVTNDNPRTEDPQNIFDDIRAGFTKSHSGHAVIADREQAIKRAVDIAQAGDIVLVAGKGHEDYQIIGTEKIHFDDREVLEKYLK